MIGIFINLRLVQFAIAFCLKFGWWPPLKCGNSLLVRVRNLECVIASGVAFPCLSPFLLVAQSFDQLFSPLDNTLVRSRLLDLWLEIQRLWLYSRLQFFELR
jgi:hypothetical protein